MPATAPPVDLEVAVDPDAPTAVIEATVAAALAGRAAEGPAVRLVVELAEPAPWAAVDAAAEAAGFGGRRDLLQLRRPLPVPADHPLRRAPVSSTRPIAADGSDDEAWLRANNRAFATHPDQGRQSAATLAAQRAEPWYDRRGFLVADDADRPGELAGFCWTKVHPATGDDPALGEIYVIGVDPAHRGEGLGPGLVLAGLDHLAAEGLGTANLYVDDDNAPAVALYDRLGFAVHARRRVYSP
ncbi:MAG: mycothiol synthase [Acidimicrobiales bacterium]|nr:mycothiol synthase [Acidimicrobiales bacterium]